MSLSIEPSATFIPIPDPIRRGQATRLWIIRDAEGAEIDRFPGFRIASEEEALAWHRERVADREAATLRPPRVRPVTRRIAPVRPAWLYHFTTGDGLLGILGEDRIRAASQHVLDGRTVSGVSLTRDRWFVYEASKPFRLALDPSRMPCWIRTIPIRDAYIQNQHKAHPIDDGVRSAPFNEAEEFLIGPLRPVAAALTEIAFLEDLLDVTDHDPSARRALRRLPEIDLPSQPRLLAVDRRRPFGARERPLDAFMRETFLPAAQGITPTGKIGVPSWPALLARVLHDARLPNSAHHGDSHWRAVAAAGRMLCKQMPDADRTAVTVFALVHDSQRVNDDGDPGHGRRASFYLRDLVADGLIAGEAVAIERLARAIAAHADGRLSADPTTACCWDADRLNLWRVNVEPDPDRLCTATAKTPASIAWARTLHDTAPSWEAVLADDFDPHSVGGTEPHWL